MDKSNSIEKNTKDKYKRIYYKRSGNDYFNIYK
jgi:hypothetical protein